MNENPTKATKWKGRILFAIEHYTEDKPILKVDNLNAPTEKERKDANKILEERKAGKKGLDRFI